MLGIKQINQARVSKQYYTSILNYPLSFGLNRTEEISTLRIEKLSKKKKGGGETFRFYDENKKYEDEIFSISGSELVMLWRENVMVVVILPRVLAKIG